MKVLKFNNGDAMPALGLGTYKIPGEKMDAVIKTALNTGYRHIDCAFYYKNEKSVGRALENHFSSSTLTREKVWITSKLWNNAHKKEDVVPALKTSLQDLRLDYLDLYMIHWPVVFKPEVKGVPQSLSDYLTPDEVPVTETWEVLVEAKEQGLVKHLGVSNFSLKKLKALVENTDTPPEVLQVESHPFLPQNELLEYCRNHQIHFTAYSPLGRGKKGEEGIPSLLEESTIQEIAQKHGCEPAQVILQWGIQRGTAVIPKATSPAHIQSNLESLEIQLEEEDIEKLNAIPIHHRYGWGNSFLLPGSPYGNVFDE